MKEALEILHYTFQRFILIFELSLLKVMVAIFVAITSFFFGGLYTQAIIAIVMLMIFDTILGVAAAKYNGEPITSRRFSRAILKGTAYMASVSAAYFADLTIPLDFIQSTMISFVGVTEFVSIVENVGKLGFQTPQKLLNQLKGKYHDDRRLI